MLYHLNTYITAVFSCFVFVFSMFIMYVSGQVQLYVDNWEQVKIVDMANHYQPLGGPGYSTFIEVLTYNFQI